MILPIARREVNPLRVSFAKTNLGKPPPLAEKSAKIQSARNLLPLSAFAFSLASGF